MPDEGGVDRIFLFLETIGGMMQRTKIEWTDYTWNPILGLCPGDCWYCYAKKLHQRFKWNPEIRPSEEYPNITDMPLFDRKRKIISRKVFVCSTFELFHPSVKKEWRDWVFTNIKYNAHLTFLILTKFPQNIDRPMPDNVWLGVSITNSGDMIRHWRLRDIKARIKFISMEPMLEDIITIPHIRSCNWIIVGRLTGHGKKYNPKKHWIDPWVRWSRSHDIPIFIKDNLKEIWGEKLIQEMPE